jgi:PKD repeat protein
VDIEGALGFWLEEPGGNEVLINDSSHITLDGGSIKDLADQASPPAIAVTGDSSDVTISRERITGSTGSGGIYVDTTGSGITMSSDYIDAGFGSYGIDVNASPGTVITGNTILGYCGYGIKLEGGSGGSTVENNAIGYPDNALGQGYCTTADSTALTVAATADTSGTTANYNAIYTNGVATASEYSWGGSTFASPTAFNTATGQGSADIESDPDLNHHGQITDASSPLISSADSDAPGETDTDIDGAPRVCAPDVTPTGVGSSACDDRGAFQYTDSVTATGATLPPTGVPAELPISLNAGTPTSSWSGATFSYRVSFGDGTVVTSTTPDVVHTYSAPGSYDIVVETVSSFGGTSLTGVHVYADPLGPFTHTLALTAEAGMIVQANITLLDDKPLTQQILNWGDGSSTDVAYGGSWPTHTYTAPGTYTVTLTASDAGGNTATESSLFSAIAQPLPAADSTVFALGLNDSSVQEWGGVANGWVTIGGSASALYAGEAGVFAVTSDGSTISSWNQNSRAWTRAGGAGAQFVVSGDALYALTPDRSAVMRYNGATWSTVGGPAQAIYPAAAGVFATSPGNTAIYQYTGLNWIKVGGAGSQFVTSGNTLYGLGPNGSYVAKWKGTGTGWTIIGGAADKLYAAGLGMFATNPTDTAIYQYSGTPNTWSKIGGGGYDFAVSETTLYGQSAAGGNVYQYTGTPGQWTNIGGKAATIIGG